MKVICIDSNGLIQGTIFGYGCKPLIYPIILSVGKTYDVIKEESHRYHIMSDIGSIMFFEKRRFKPLYEIRNEKLEKILE